MKIDTNNTLDFSEEDFNGFYYTNDKQIRKMDDALIVSKIIERYPDFSESSSENTLRQVFLVIASDSTLINEIAERFDLEIPEIFSIIYRNYSEIFNPPFISKVQKLISRKKYAKSVFKNRKSPARKPRPAAIHRGPGRPPKDKDV